MYAITGMNTLSSKLPWLAAKPIAASLPMTCTATIVTASHCVGLTLPGMMELPGSLAGILISPRPRRGPLASQRTSLAIFIMLAARPLTAPWEKTSASLPVSARNLLGSVTNGRPVSSASSSATATSKPAGALRPVPTAVPPSARRTSCGMAARSSSREPSRSPRQPEISCANEMGTASCRWVRPLLTTPAHSRSRRANVAASWSIAGSRRPVTASAAATCMAVGKVSLDDWLMFTESLGCRGRSSSAPRSAASWLPRLARTSFMFMLDWVPEPVCHTTSGKSASWQPSRTSSAAAQMRSRSASPSRPRRQFARAAAFFTSANAETISRGMRSVPMGKFSWLRSVCAPHRASAGTRISPIESRSTRQAPVGVSAPDWIFPPTR